MAMIQLKNIKKAYDDKLVYDNFNLQLEEGKITVVLGESGSGKTTLMNILMGLTDFEGEIINIPNKFSVVFQTNVLVPSLTVEENIKLVNPNADVESLLKMGMLRRVAIVRALSVNADMLLLDEPFINLDLSLKNHLINVIKNRVKEQNETLLMITHDIKEAVLMGDRIVVISDGKKIYEKDVDGEKTEKEIFDLMINLKKY